MFYGRSCLVTHELTTFSYSLDEELLQEYKKEFLKMW